MEKCIAVIDMRAFYSYVECVERKLDPYKTPLVVADKERGKNTIVLSVSPFLKKRGVPSRLRIMDLPGGYDYVYAVPRMALYMKRSAEVVACMLDYIGEEDVHVYSVDEAFLNIAPYLSYYRADPYTLVKRIKDHIMDVLSLEATAGIGSNMFLAKVALDCYAKKEKDGIATIHMEDVPAKLWPIAPLNKVWGIGSHLERRLNALGMYKLGDIAKADPDFMRVYFKSLGPELVERANGREDGDIREEYVPMSRSLTQGQTLFRDYRPSEMPLVIRETLDDLSFRMRSKGVTGQVVHLFIGYSKEGGFASQVKLLRATNMTRDLMEPVMDIFRKNVNELPIRNVSIAVSGLMDANGTEQGSLFEDPRERKRQLDLQRALDGIVNAFGNNAVLRASSLIDGSTVLERHSQIGGHRR